MKFADYIRQNGISPTRAAEELSSQEQSVSESAVSKWIYQERVPRPEMVKRIYAWSDGAVGPQDWYSLADLDGGTDDQSGAEAVAP